MTKQRVKLSIETSKGEIATEPKIKIFLADASQDFLELLSAELSEQPDLAVVGAASAGDAAYALLSLEQPDVLLMDVLLPQLDGLGLLRRLKKEGLMPRTVVLSAFVTDYVARTASRLGVDDFLPKPCDLPELLRCIRTLTGGGAVCRRSEDYDLAIREALLRFGIDSHLSGYAYLRRGIFRALEDRSVLCGITKILYPELGKAFGVSAVCVERAIRGAVDKAWNRGSDAARRAYFGDTFASCGSSPTNLRFISSIADFIELKFEREDLLQIK